MHPVQPAKIIQQSGCSDQDRRPQQLITMTTGVDRFEETESSQANQTNRRV
jgi:hypothetical protein